MTLISIIRKWGVLCALLTTFSQIVAQDAKPAFIPFTGTDYVRVLMDSSYASSSKSRLFAKITSLDNHSILWEGEVKPSPVSNEGKAQFMFRVSGLKPRLWSPNQPYLYLITLIEIIGDKRITRQTERLGFRSFESHNGTLYLNNKPIFLRGFAVNPPRRGIPAEVEESREFAEQYVKFLKSHHVNIIRIPDREVWYDVCDELGMMVFGGNYAGSVAKGAKVENFEQVGDETDGGFPADYNKGVAWFKHHKLGPIAHHPALMLYAMTNETPFAGKRAIEWEKFLDYSFKALKQWDDTRVYIANAGYGYGKTGDICDLHRYWGWYYSSPFTFIHARDKQQLIPFPKPEKQPITFTETIGNYTGPDGRYNMTPNHKNPGSQLAWTGHAETNIQAQLASAHQIFTIKNAVELVRRLRAINKDLSGIFPFTVLFYNWDTIQEFADMDPKPAAKQLKTSFQPLLLSWECWTPHMYAGTNLKAKIHVINDDYDVGDLPKTRLDYEILDHTHQILQTKSMVFPAVPYYSLQQKEIEIEIPTTFLTGNYELRARLYAEDGKLLSENKYQIFVADSAYLLAASAVKQPLAIYDPTGQTETALKALNISVKRIQNFQNLTATDALIIGENAADKMLEQQAATLKKFVENGGRILSLRQDSSHIAALNSILNTKIKSALPDIDNPSYPSPVRPSRNGYYINPERPDHPIFTGIQRQQLQVWSDYTQWEESKPGFPAIYPVTDGYMLENKADLASLAVLANYGAGLEGITLAEHFIMRGSIISSGFDLIRRVGKDPVADRLLANLCAYVSQSDGHQLHPLITNTIVWGDYESEKGLLTGINSGLIINSTPRIPETYKNQGIVITDDGDQFAAQGNRVAFASNPGLQYVANGRRPYGPYYLRGFGAMPETLNKKTKIGEGTFWCTVLPTVNIAFNAVWNPTKTPLEVSIRINDQVVKKTIAPQRVEEVNCPVNHTTVEFQIKGDRRLVLMKTTFGQI